MALINLTPHEVTIYGPSGITKIPASGQLCRVKNSNENCGVYEDIPLVRAQFGEVTGLPAQGETPDAIYIVSSIVLQALTNKGIHRSDVMAPATGPNDGAIRCARNQVQAVTKLVVM